ncbi:MAG TPA: STAS domain-containing protein [Candidatus Acidoferrales bacterium]|nr:STAS domain-containing protein [Candidatus Acidoferrales bacterium]
MRVVVSKFESGAVLNVDGRIDAVTAPQFRDQLMTLIDSGYTRIIIDCALLAYISSAGLRVLYEAANKLEPHQGRMAICRANADVRRVLEMVDIASEIPIFATQEEAIQGLRYLG